MIGPATDGGYWLLGLAAGVAAAAVFDGVPMSTAHTGAAQRDRLRQLGLSTLVLDELRDVDTIDDLRIVAAAQPDTSLGRLVVSLRRAMSGAEPSVSPACVAAADDRGVRG